VWGVASPAVGGYVKLLQLLLDEEVKRVKVWNDPLNDLAGGATPAWVSRAIGWVGLAFYSGEGKSEDPSHCDAGMLEG